MALDWICGIDGAAILKGCDYLGYADCIDPHVLLTGWRDGLRAMECGIGKHAGPPGQGCLARGLADGLDGLIRDSALEEILEALKAQIEIAEDLANGCAADPVEEWRQDYYARLSVDTSQVFSRRWHEWEVIG